MKVSAVQYTPIDGNISKNIESHLQLIRLAIASNAHLIVFPELSITGYVRERAKELAFSMDDKRWDAFIELAKENKIVIVVGAPIIINKDVFIGSIIFQPSGKTELYTKQYLHEGEDEFYASSFNYNPIIRIEDETIAFAICADIENEQHACDAHDAGASLYIASIFYTKTGINGGLKKLKSYSKEHNMAVLMSNYCGESYGYLAGGKSTFFDGIANLIGQLSEDDQSLLLIEKSGNDWLLLNC